MPENALNNRGQSYKKFYGHSSVENKVSVLNAKPRGQSYKFFQM
jgi:hypothetical protein